MDAIGVEVQLRAKRAPRPSHAVFALQLAERVVSTARVRTGHRASTNAKPYLDRVAAGQKPCNLFRSDASFSAAIRAIAAGVVTISMWLLMS